MPHPGKTGWTRTNHITTSPPQGQPTAAPETRQPEDAARRLNRSAAGQIGESPADSEAAHKAPGPDKTAGIDHGATGGQPT